MVALKFLWLWKENVATADGGTITNALVAGWAYDPVSIANGASLSVDQTLTGVAVADFVLPDFSLDLQRLALTARAKSANFTSATFLVAL